MSTSQVNPRIPGVHSVVERISYSDEPEPLNRRIYGWARLPFVGLFWLVRYLLTVAALAGGLALLGAVLIAGAMMVLGLLLTDQAVTWDLISRMLPVAGRRVLDIAPWLLIATLPASLKVVR